LVGVTFTGFCFGGTAVQIKPQRPDADDVVFGAVVLLPKLCTREEDVLILRNELLGNLV